jgi:hypothetical protein
VTARTGVVLVLFAALQALPAQARDERTAAVGMRARIDEIVIEGSEVIVAPADRKAPVVVRILATRPHGQHFRYDLEWSGLEPGRHDLGKRLARKDGSSTQVQSIPVEVTGRLGKGVIEATEIPPAPAERLDGYRNLQIAAAVAWTVGLLLILFVGRRWRRATAAAAVIPSLADRLRPLVEAAAAGRADDAAKAELERLLVAFWRAKLGLREAKADAAIRVIREHAEAGALLREVEAWLHRPVPPSSFDVGALLEPYRTVRAEDFDAPPRREEAASVR